MNYRFLAVVFCLALFGALLVPSARADEADQKMIMTVRKGAVEVPGRILQPGKYDLKFADVDEHVLEITTADGREPIGFFEVVPISRLRRTDYVRLDLSEAAPGSVTRLSDFFYPDMKTGYKFEYPQPTVSAMASKTTQTHFANR